MTNAERQKRYRDKNRGGPPVGRWAGHVSVAMAARLSEIGRTSVFMCQWVCRHAPDVSPQFESGELKVVPTYKRLMAEYKRGLVEALKSREDQRGVRLVERRQDGRFVFEWVADMNQRADPDTVY